MWVEHAMGFSEKIIVSKHLCVPFENISFEQATLVEPMGVAIDLCEVAEIKLNDRVLIIGLGPIGIMAINIAKHMGASKVIGAHRSTSTKRIEIAKEFGLDEVVLTDKVSLDDYVKENGLFDKVLVTAPPKLVETGVKLLKFGGILSFIGIQYGDGANITIDANNFHFNRLQLRASHASPAFFFPKCINMIENGLIHPEKLVTDRFSLEEMGTLVNRIKNDKSDSVKSIMVNDKINM